MASLKRHSLINFAGEGFYIHRMVQAVTRDGLSEDGQKSWAEAAVMLMDAAFPYDSNQVQTWSECATLLPHALAAVEHAEKFKVASVATGHLLNQTGLHLQEIAEFEQARKCFERALKIAEEIYGPDHPEVATNVNNLGLALQFLGDEDARKCYKRALKILQEKYGEDHPITKNARNNLKSLGPSE